MVTLKLHNSFILGATTKFYHRFWKLMRRRMQSTHRMYPTTKCFTLYSTIRQTTVLRADLLHFPGPKKLPKLVGSFHDVWEWIFFVQRLQDYGVEEKSLRKLFFRNNGRREVVPSGFLGHKGCTIFKSYFSISPPLMSIYWSNAMD